MILESAQMLCTAKRVLDVQNILILQRMSVRLKDNGLDNPNEEQLFTNEV